MAIFNACVKIIKKNFKYFSICFEFDPEKRGLLLIDQNTKYFEIDKIYTFTADFQYKSTHPYKRIRMQYISKVSENNIKYEGAVFHKDGVSVGDRFDRLCVIEYAGVIKGRSHWSCLCECGKFACISARNLKDKRTRSCGCLKKESINNIRESNLKDNTNLAKIKSNSAYSNSSTGYRGISVRGCRYLVSVTASKERKYLGVFKSLEEAIQARDQYRNDFLAYQR